MNKFYIDKEAYKYLSDWAEQNRNAVVWSTYFFKDVEVILKDSTFRFFVNSKLNYFKFNLKGEQGIIYSGRISHDETGENDFIISYKSKLQKEKPDSYVDILTTYCNAFFNANCFMWRGNLVDDKVFTASGKNKHNSKIITFRKFKENIYAISAGHHRNPEGVFVVRGHFRQYKSGKVIWIDEYLKGTKLES